jgi:diguanylate cyclase (GGDEF)-like protein
MNRRRIGIYGAHEESLRLVRLLGDSAEVEVAGVYHPDREAALAQAQALGPEFAAELEAHIVDDFETFLSVVDYHAIVDDGQLEPFRSREPGVVESGVQVVSPLTARLLWGYEDSPCDRKAELLQALSEVVESLELTIDSDELFVRMLEIAVGVTGADGGSLMLLDEASRELYIQVAIGVEPELWGKIRVPLGEGIAGHVAASARSLHLRGKADRRHFHIVRERLDVESALSVPLVQDGRVLGVLNLHHPTRTDAFSEDDLHFMERVAVLDAKIIHRAREHQDLRNQAARFEAVQEISGLFADPAPIGDRLQQICHRVASRMGNGIANIYLCDAERPGRAELLLTATSLEGGGFGGEYRIGEGQGVDGRAATSGRPIFLRTEDGALAYAALPLKVGERLVGVLTAQAGEAPPRGRAAREGLLEIAAAVAEGVARSERERLMHTRATRAGAINETGIRMLSATDLTEVGQLATSSLAMLLDADHAVLRLQDPETRRYRIRSYFGSADELLQPRLFELDKQTCVESIRRRTAFLLADLNEHPGLAEFSSDFRSLISAPLKHDGQVVGTLSIYDKVAVDRFFAGRFTDEDLQIFAKFVSYVERAVNNARTHAIASQHTNFDADTGLPNASYLSSRVHEEIVRASGRDDALALAVCSIDNWIELVAGAGMTGAHRVLVATTEALRAELRDFDVVGRTGDGHFTVLLPEPGRNTHERITGLARSVADRISRDPKLNDPVRVALSFGYARYPEDGEDHEELMKRAAEPRIRMV